MARVSGRLLKGVPGRIEGTDEEIWEYYQQQPFLHFVQRKYKVGLSRLRKIVRGHEKQ